MLNVLRRKLGRNLKYGWTIFFKNCRGLEKYLKSALLLDVTRVILTAKASRCFVQMLFPKRSASFLKKDLKQHSTTLETSHTKSGRGSLMDFLQTLFFFTLLKKCLYVPCGISLE